MYEGFKKKENKMQNESLFRRLPMTGNERRAAVTLSANRPDNDDLEWSYLFYACRNNKPLTPKQWGAAVRIAEKYNAAQENGWSEREKEAFAKVGRRKTPQLPLPTLIASGVALVAVLVAILK